MSRKRTKQYLMLLMVIGLVSIAAGGSGTFASFDAETTNAGNYFATGTLILNDNGGTNTCTSAVASNNHNNTGTNCDTLFNINNTQLVQPYATLATSILVANVAAATTIDVSGTTLKGAGIDVGDTVTLTNSQGETASCTATARADIGATAISVGSCTTSASNDFLSGSTSVLGGEGTFYAQLTLTNAGTIDANGIKFDAAATLNNGAYTCSTTYQEPAGTITSQLTAGATISSLALQLTTTTGSPKVSTGVAVYHDGQPIVVSAGGNAQTFVVSGNQNIPSNGTIASLSVVSQKANATYANGSTARGPQFTGAQQDFCSSLNFAIIETDNTFDDNNALGCAWGDVGSPTSLGCDLTSNTKNLGNLPTSLTALTLAPNASSNSGTELDHGQSRYFLLALKLPSYSFTNADQNRATAAFDLTWHIDQV